MADKYDPNDGTDYRRAFFANYGAMTLVTYDEDANLESATKDTEVQVAALKGVTITPKFEHVTLYGMERVTRAAVAKHSLAVDVSIEVAMWNPEADAILKSVLLGRNTAEAITEANLNDPEWKNKVAYFDITMEMIDTDRERKVELKATDVYFESVPYEMKENEFISRALSGTAKAVVIKNYEWKVTGEIGAWVEMTNTEPAPPAPDP